MRILKNTITILAEIIVLILSTLWYLKTKEYEPLIAMIIGGVGLLTSLISKWFLRPRIVLHQQKTDWGRLTKGYTNNNPLIIRLGIDIPNQYWELFWNHILEIRNNSSQTAYSIDIKHINTPHKTYINEEIGKIEPLLANEKRDFKVKIIQNTTGTHIQADDYLKTNIKTLMKDAKILVKYEDESGTKFYTEYDWLTDTNKFKLFNNFKNKKS
ncbi:hypothetical protein [Thermophagus xiamenensis]|uniref:Uncharacterized protein n=1 Tax=Thermophagus xiamenensis TaxID=385682 RepID=A0A1I2G061_9BACT|nr:hypothetical protein [Thermophagus xiamenensis]SFF10447.1 hypothetical protein SAMN05444380_1422 [Thermophagus xiamenensis]